MHRLYEIMFLIVISSLVMTFQTQPGMKFKDLKVNPQYQRNRNNLNQKYSKQLQNGRIIQDISQTYQIKNKQETFNSEKQLNTNPLNNSQLIQHKIITEQNVNELLNNFATPPKNSSSIQTTQFISNISTGDWIETTVQQQLSNSAWIIASKYFSIIRSSEFSPNQVILLLKKINQTGTFFNFSSKIESGISQTIISVSNQKAILFDYQIVKNLNNVSLNRNLQFNLTQSVLQSLFYDFLLSPFNLTNGFQIHYSGFVLYNLSYSSKNGLYNFFVKSELNSKGVFVTTVLKCNPIVFNVTTHTSPVIANINIIYKNKNFEFVNQSVKSFIAKTLNKSNFIISYDSITLWTDRSGSNILYYLNLTLLQNQTKQGYKIGVNYDLNTRQRIISYWKKNSPLASYNKDWHQYQQVQFFQVAPNSIFSNIYLLARNKHIQGPLIKIQIKKVSNSTSFRLTYFQEDEKHAQVQYTQQTK